MRADSSFAERWALRLWCIAMGTFFGAIVIGVVIGVTNPRSMEAAFAIYTVPVLASFANVPLLLAGLLLSLWAMVNDRPRARSVVAAILCLVTLVPACAALVWAVQWLSGAT